MAAKEGALAEEYDARPLKWHLKKLCRPFNQREQVHCERALGRKAGFFVNVKIFVAGVELLQLIFMVGKIILKNGLFHLSLFH